MFTSRKGRKGFGLVEILVTMGVLSVGILGVTVLHGVITEQSQENKARAEASSIAESRIEDMRNYTNSVASLADFNTLYADTSGYANSSSITGVNAAFTRAEQIGTVGDLKTVAVRVTWTDPDGDSQSVSLNSELTYVAPRSIGDTALEAAASLVDAPTGRARLGEGQLPNDAVTTSNADGTSLYNAGGTELMLVSGGQIVLTLAEACQTETGACIDFVKIKGRIYIDTTSQSTLDPGEVYVVASDAAFCARHFTANGTTTAVTPTTTTTLSTASGQYEYFDYTCYIGGGWHGNVGVIFAAGLSQADKICMGDPPSLNPWEAPVIATRRVYRGMLYKKTTTTPFREQVAGTNGILMDRFYSQGIADSVEFPAPNSGDKSHDFVIGSFNANLTDGSNCESRGIMTRSDATVSNVPGALFSGMPTDFICLNDGYLDTYDTTVYGHAALCPYDPSDPPSTRHLLSGSIRLRAASTTGNAIIASSIYTITSNGPGNCLTSTFNHDGTYYNGTYECDVYDWGNGWNGYVEAKYDASNMSCTPYQLTKTNLTAASTGNNFTACSTGSYAVFTGTVTTSGGRRLRAATMTNGGACTVATNGLSYECRSSVYVGTTQSFTMTFTATSGVMCKAVAPHSGTHAYTSRASGNYTLNLKIAANTNGC